MQVNLDRAARHKHEPARIYCIITGFVDTANSQMPINHRLDPLLNPTSIALMGVSEKPDSPGQVLAKMIIESAYCGRVYAVNPRYSTIAGQPCYRDLKSLPSIVDHVIIALGNAGLEAALRETIEHGARAATIYASGVLEPDCKPELLQRLRALANAAGIAICGSNGMGFYNLSQNLYAGIFPRKANIPNGNISYIAQSGSAFTTLVHNGCQLGFNLCVSTGNEMVTSIADYMDWSLAQPETRVIGLFLESIRDPKAFVTALETANSKNVPVVILKIGKSALGASMALSHTGAIAGDHAVFQALCKRYGIIEVDDFDEMASILLLLQSGRAAALGDLAASFESGGLRELVTDQADRLGIRFAALENSTKTILTRNLEPGLKAENPLDAWGSHQDFEARFENCMNALMQDPNVAAGAFISNFRDDYYLSEAIFRVVDAVSKKTAKPIAMATCYSDLANPELNRRARMAGIPLIAGVRESLLAFKHLFDYRDFKSVQAEALAPNKLNRRRSSAWKQRLALHDTNTLSESDAYALLSDFGLDVVSHMQVTNQAELLQAATTIGYPLVLKTALSGINHKSDCHGVYVNIVDKTTLLARYEDLCQRFGPRALLAEMVLEGVEIALGTRNDPQFGPIIMVAAGGTLIEFIADRAVALCPVNHRQAEAMIAALKVDGLLRGFRGNRESNRQVLCDQIVALSVLAVDFSAQITEIDINPILAGTSRSRAVDALVILKTAGNLC